MELTIYEDSNYLCISASWEYKENLICTYGGSEAFKSMESIIDDKHDNLVGRFSCKGFDTFGPFKLIGGVAKGHPNDKDLVAAVEFYKKLIAGVESNE